MCLGQEKQYQFRSLYPPFLYSSGRVPKVRPRGGWVVKRRRLVFWSPHPRIYSILTDVFLYTAPSTFIYLYFCPLLPFISSS